MLPNLAGIWTPLGCFKHVQLNLQLMPQRDSSPNSIPIWTKFGFKLGFMFEHPFIFILFGPQLMSQPDSCHMPFPFQVTVYQQQSSTSTWTSTTTTGLTTTMAATTVAPPSPHAQQQQQQQCCYYSNNNRGSRHTCILSPRYAFFFFSHSY